MGARMEMFSGPDFAVGSMLVMRQWTQDKQGRLHSPHQNFLWKPGESVAECHFSFSNEGAKHPRQGCGCGFYAYYQDTFRPHHGTVTGIIEAYGHVVIGELGVRAQKARIVAVVEPRMPRKNAVIKRLAALCIPIFIAGVLGVIGFFATAAMLDDPRWLFPAFGSIPLMGLAMWAELRAEHVTSPPKVRYQVKDLYPDVKVYPSAKAMLRAHKVDRKPVPRVPTPQDEDFWTLT